MPGDVTMELNADQATDFMRAVWSDQLPFATTRAINWSALGGQRVQRAHQHKVFEVRRPQFVDRAVKIAQFASKRQDPPEARMRVEPPGGQRRADVISKFETEWEKRPHKAEALWVPTDDVTANGIVLKGWRPRQLAFRRWGQGPKARVLRGKKRTFAIIQGKNKGWIFERDENDLTLLYTRHQSVPIDADLHFQDNIRRHVLDNWDANFNRAFLGAMRTAR